MAAAEFGLASKTCMIEYTIKAYEGVHEGEAVPQGKRGTSCGLDRSSAPLLLVFRLRSACRKGSGDRQRIQAAT